jgi:hypothetical protein
MRSQYYQILFRVKIGFVTPVRTVVRLASEYGSVEPSLCLLNVFRSIGVSYSSYLCSNHGYVILSRII